MKYQSQVAIPILLVLTTSIAVATASADPSRVSKAEKVVTLGHYNATGQKAGIWLNKDNPEENFNIGPGEAAIFNKFGYCAEIRIGAGAPTGILVPLGSPEEWRSFREHNPAYVYANSCGSSCGVQPANTRKCPKGPAPDFPAGAPVQQTVYATAGGCTGNNGYLHYCEYYCDAGYRLAGQSCVRDGGWGDWGSCSASCGWGEQSRECNDPPPSPGGNGCSGSATQSCFIEPCCESDGSCDANPSCDTTAYGTDNCGNPCSETGPACTCGDQCGTYPDCHACTCGSECGTYPDCHACDCGDQCGTYPNCHACDCGDECGTYPDCHQCVIVDPDPCASFSCNCPGDDGNSCSADVDNGAGTSYTITAECDCDGNIEHTGSGCDYSGDAGWDPNSNVHQINSNCHDTP